MLEDMMSLIVILLLITFQPIFKFPLIFRFHKKKIQKFKIQIFRVKEIIWKEKSKSEKPEENRDKKKQAMRHLLHALLAVATADPLQQEWI